MEPSVTLQDIVSYWTRAFLEKQVTGRRGPVNPGTPPTTTQTPPRAVVSTTVSGTWGVGWGRRLSSAPQGEGGRGIRSRGVNDRTDGRDGGGEETPEEELSFDQSAVATRSAHLQGIYG